MFRKRILQGLTTCLIAVGATERVYAELVTFAFSGTLTSVNVDNIFPDPSPFPQPTVFGTPFQGTYSFDPAAPNGIPADPTQGSYQSPTGTFTLDLGGLSFLFVNINISVQHFTGNNDFYSVLHYERPTISNPTGVNLSISLLDSNASSIVDNLQPLIPPSLAGFDTTNAFFFTDTIDGIQVEFGGAIDSLTAVPEPPLLIIVALGAALFASWRRRSAVVPA